MSRSLAAVERIQHSGDSPWVAEHESRYRWVASSTRGKVVLDVASGAGFGSRILAEAGASLVVGLDLVHEASNAPFSDRIMTVSGDAHRIPLRTASMDAVVTFETIEHLERPADFISEIRRVLRPDGELFLSSPNAAHSARDEHGAPLNPFHKHEFLPEELGAVVEGAFPNVEMFGQLINDDFGVCPFWQPRHVRRSNFTKAVRSFLWSVCIRMPSRLGQRLCRMVLRQELFPGAEDFTFVRDAQDDSHVVLARARRNERKPDS